ncbi:MAG: efflux RND transporter periplasmic adaptor subunit [Kiritimatiellia bacterium]|jgi:multidrug efflux pump subunit AcrA (membrane-fusion protein)|nr:efflux RND transporter periplasmic adaptor subunit [Kiritimatiellia bacterium]
MHQVQTFQRNASFAITLLGIALLAASSLIVCAEAEDSHAGHDHSTHAAGHGAAEPQLVPVTREQVSRLGIKIAPAAKGNVRRQIRVPGEIKINSDRLAHVVPRASGIVREVESKVGDNVESGEMLAWIESDELATAKLDFYSKVSEVGCCEIRLPRAKEIFGNVARLIALLKKGAGEEEIKTLDGLEMGSYRGRLLTAYATHRSAKTTHERESTLRAKQISSAQDLLTAETKLAQARANFQAAMDTARYETLVAYSEAAQERQVAEFDAVAAEKQLRLKGADEKVVAELRSLVPKTSGLEPCLCNNPNCKEDELPSLEKALGKDKRFAWYPLRSPFAGTLIEKHIALGESIESTSEVFTIADLSSVWVDLAISQESIPEVREEYPIEVQLPDGSKSEAKIQFVSPVVAPETRTALARATLDNTSGQFRPGTFIEAVIHVPSNEKALIVPKASVQLINDHPCVFVWGKGAFEMREVKTGRSDSVQTEILRGLQPGEKVAAVNAFHLKAEYIKSAAGDLGAHHGHSH